MNTEFQGKTVNPSNSIDSVVKFYQDTNTQDKIKRFLNQVSYFFESDSAFYNDSPPLIHSVKWRIKNPEHLRDKLLRKIDSSRIITPDNLFYEITDLAGVRVLHLYQEQFSTIHKRINDMISEGEWKFRESAKAYTWDPDAKKYFCELGIDTDIKPTHYTSVHYVVQPNNDSAVCCCEIQVRTLFEEIWGEIDHAINYPHPTKSIACREQIRVLSKLVSTGTRLSDSIFRSFAEFRKKQQKGK